MGGAGVRGAGGARRGNAGADRSAGLGEGPACTLQDSEGRALCFEPSPERDGKDRQARGRGVVYAKGEAAMTPALASLLALLVAIVVSIASKMNVGLVALVFA